MATRKAKARRTVRSRAELARIGPVATAVALQQMGRHMTVVSISVFMAEDGAPARDLLSHLCWMLAIGAEISAQLTPGTAQAKRLHAALRSVVQMGIDDAWQSSQAPAIDTAANEAKALLIAHPTAGLALIPSADWLSSRIRDGVARLSDVAGAEIYSPQPQGNLA